MNSLPPNAKLRYGAYLPHLTSENGIYAVTFRLADSLPQSVLQVWVQERESFVELAQRSDRGLSMDESKQLQRLFSERIESYLDSGIGQCWMNKPEIADLVENAIKFFHGSRYELMAWCVMPNHVHVVVHPTSGFELSDITHSWKSYTAHQANKLLNRTGVFWQPEPYDHLIRDEDDLEHSVEYVLANPAAAGLGNWRWVGVTDNIASILTRGSGVSPDSSFPTKPR